jgi:SnoaL-like domain
VIEGEDHQSGTEQARNEQARNEQARGVRRLLDRNSLEELARRYCRGLDRRDPLLLRSVFHDDATTHYGAFAGSPDEFVGYAMNALSTHESTQHLLGQVNLWFDGDDRATGEVYFTAFHRLVRDGARTDLTISGRYLDRYERRAGDWGVSRRTEVVDWARTEPAQDDYTPARPALVCGRPGPDDLSYRIDQA